MKIKNVKRIILILLTILLMSEPTHASVTRLFVGDMDGSPMAGIDTKINFGPLFVGGEVRTLIRQAITNSAQYAVVGFAPGRTDYTFRTGLELGMMTLEYASTCYHTVYSGQSANEIVNAEILPNTQSISVIFQL
jgi:hypothetical protein